MGKAKTNKKGRSENPTGRFARLPHEILLSPAYCSLTPNARALLDQLIAMECGDNNGSLWLSVRDAAARIGLSNRDSANRAFAELTGAGLLAMTKEAHFSIKASDTSRARCWRLTFLHAPGTGKTDDWRQFKPADKAAARRMDLGLAAHNAYRKALSQEKLPVLNSRTIKEAAANLSGEAVHNLRTVKPDSGEKRPNFVVHDLRPHTAATMPPICWQDGGRLIVVPTMDGHRDDRLARPHWRHLLGTVGNTAEKVAA